MISTSTRQDSRAAHDGSDEVVENRFRPNGDGLSSVPAWRPFGTTQFF